MKRIRLDPAVRRQMREIHAFTRERWGERKAEEYVRDLSARFDEIATGRAHSVPVPAMFGVVGWYTRAQAHFVYWRPLDDDVIAIVAVLHQQMHQRERVQQAFGGKR